MQKLLFAISLNMKVLLTGSTGFLGSALATGLSSSNCTVNGLSRSLTSDIQCDLSQDIPLIKEKYDLVIHAMGLAHVSNSMNKEKFHKLNVEGTRHLLMGLSNILPRQIVFISTVAVYGKTKGENIAETEPTNPTTDYGMTKLLAEMEILNWANEHGVCAVILRLPLISGPNPIGNLGALGKSIYRRYYFRIGDGKARKSMVGVNDLVKLMPKLIGKAGIYNLTDGVHPRVCEIDTFIAKGFDREIRKIPNFLIKIAANIFGFIPGFPLNKDRLNKLANHLTFDDSLARRELNWNPDPALESLSFDRWRSG